MAAAVSALAVAAGGLVSAAVIGVGVGPALADHCDPAEATQSPPAQQGEQDQNRNRNQDQNQDQDQPQDQEQQAPDEQSPDQQAPDEQQDEQQDNGGQDADQQAPEQQEQAPEQQEQAPEQQEQAPQGGGAAVLDPAESAEPEESASTFGRRGRPNPTRTATPIQTPTPSEEPTEDPTEPPAGEPTEEPTGSPSPSPSPTATGGAEEECADLGPFPEDFVDIRRVSPGQGDARIGRNGSSGSFVSQCGTNRNGHNNPDNFIVAPGVSNGAHHLHDYVGNLSTDAFSTDESLAAADTTCRQSDKSTYFWPVLRDRKSDENVEDPDGNVGQVLRARSVSLQFRGNATSDVVAMPRFLRLITGDAKAATNGTANARAAWTCSGFQNRITPDKYPLCPRGSQVIRILDFPSCWDGQNTDSANHRTHVVFPDQSGACPQGTKAVPQLRMTLTYSVPQGPSYALDAFPEQKHNPVTDHADFANVMPDRLMQTVVSCINRGRRC
ncbi:DUF1996 domain-containing protein [Nonomuraea sp. K274]|uniref:DUF1996 domain-containing protein n=2 Tax=Nonomuraea cypriaca TaxID=1187855 RepID=A0A931AKX9_9ACTN|nr:DUF1996 domain-containing protein [Nonomuraea cypriaca]